MDFKPGDKVTVTITANEISAHGTQAHIAYGHADHREQSLTVRTATPGVTVTDTGIAIEAEVMQAAPFFASYGNGGQRIGVKPGTPGVTITAAR